TGEPVGDFTTRFVAPSRHRYSALTALDHFRDVALHEGRAPDPRMADAVAVVRDARQPDGTWLQTTPLAGRTWFDVDAGEGEPSKWLTLAGTRVLDWWDAAAA
ncbi:squalene cyclase, partial [Microbacterium sp. zg.Y909]|nr:squalene cyclase [Microbacterium sp. zg.Y909]